MKLRNNIYIVNTYQGIKVLVNTESNKVYEINQVTVDLINKGIELGDKKNFISILRRYSEKVQGLDSLLNLIEIEDIFDE